MGFMCSVPLAPETHSHSRVTSGRGSDCHPHTHNNCTPLPGSHGCLPRSRPAHLSPAPALQLARVRRSASERNRKKLGCPRQQGSHKGLGVKPTGLAERLPPILNTDSSRTSSQPKGHFQRLKHRENAAENSRATYPEREFNLLPHLQGG